jgi:hypothetical protein
MRVYFFLSMMEPLLRCVFRSLGTSGDESWKQRDDGRYRFTLPRKSALGGNEVSDALEGPGDGEALRLPERAQSRIGAGQDSGQEYETVPAAARNWARQRCRRGPIVPTGTPSASEIS